MVKSPRADRPNPNSEMAAAVVYTLILIYLLIFNSFFHSRNHTNNIFNISHFLYLKDLISEIIKIKLILFDLFM